MIVLYTDKVEGGERVRFTPVILINPKYKDDKGLHEHEKLHVLHWAIFAAVIFPIVLLFSNWLVAGVAAITAHDALYHFVSKFRLWSEVQCYRKQAKYSPQHIGKFAEFIATKYNLKISASEALRRLSK